MYGRRASDHDRYHQKRGDQGQPGDDDSSGGDAVYGSYDDKISGQIYKKSSDIRFVIHDGSTFILKDGLENGIIDVTTLRTPIALNGFCSKLLVQEHCLP